MNAPFLAPAGVQLRDEVNKRFPNRDKASDGWIGDTSHQARPSDHNPDWKAPGKSHAIVRAVDIDISPDGRPVQDLRKQVLRAVVGSARAKYVISDGVIWSQTHGWKPHKYTGSNPHTSHVHVSLDGSSGQHVESNFDTSPWFKQPKPKPEPEPEPRRDTRARVENFRRTAPEWDLKIIDRAIKAGRGNLAKDVKDIETAVKALPDDKKDTLVVQFVERFEKDRVLQMNLLNKSVKNGRDGAVKNQRNKIRASIKSILWV